MNKKPTIADIARAAGVSLATVSRILNNKPDVSEKTRKHVLKIIDEQGYTPQTQWQQIASGKSRTISMLYPRDYAAFNPWHYNSLWGQRKHARKEITSEPDYQIFN